MKTRQEKRSEDDIKVLHLSKEINCVSGRNVDSGVGIRLQGEGRRWVSGSQSFQSTPFLL